MTTPLPTPSAPTASPAPQLRFRLPGSWWQVLLNNPGDAKESVHRLVARAAGHRDDQARERDAMRRQLNAAVEKAISGGALSLHIALEIIEDLPVPASFTVFQPALRFSPAIGTGGPAIIDILLRGLRERADFDEENSAQFVAHDSHVLRTHRHELIAAEPILPGDNSGTQELDTLIVDYWLTVPGEKRVVLVSFSTALGGLEEIMLGFFDSIIAATYWSRMGETAQSPGSAEPAETSSLPAGQ